MLETLPTITAKCTLNLIMLIWGQKWKEKWHEFLLLLGAAILDVIGRSILTVKLLAGL